MTTIFIRSLVIYVILLILMRLMGKRQIGEMQPFEFVITLLIAELACIPMADVSVPLVYGIVTIIAVFILHQLFTVFEQSSKTVKKIISGKPAIVLNKNGIDFSELKRNNLSVEDLIESMRSAGYFSLDDIDYAIFESNGKLSALKKENSKQKRSESLPILLIDNGKTVDKNFKFANFDKTYIEKVLREKNMLLKSVGVMTLDGNGKVYLQKESEKYITFDIPLPEGVKW